jgi:hypothetical protein
MALSLSRPRALRLDGPLDCHASICGGPFAKKYDKRAGRIMLRDFRKRYFGKHKRLTKERCEEFFSNDANFIDV